MGEFFVKLFDSDFMGHGYCYLWKPDIVRLHATSDGLIALSYYFIPLVLIYLVRRRRDLPFHWMFLMFGVFILGCGTTHLMEIWTLWHGTYRLAGVIKAITAAASVATAVALIPMVPRAMQLPSPFQLQAANLELEKEIARRKVVEEALETERNFVGAILNTVDTIITVLDLKGRIVQCNSACEQVSGRSSRELKGRHYRNLFNTPEEAEHFQSLIEESQGGHRSALESHWTAPDGHDRVISWTTTILTDAAGRTRHIIAAGVDITESKQLQKAVLDISAREERRIGQDLHDGLGQQLTGIAFLSKVLAHRLAEQSFPAAPDAAKIVELVNGAINKTRELSHGLLPVTSDALGLVSALERLSRDVDNLFGVVCTFISEESILVYDEDVATHTYRIAQEAVNNAIKHGHPTLIEMSLLRNGESVVMTVRDNGIGLAQNSGASGKKGMGLHIMNYRAKMIGAELKVERGPKGGTVVACQLRLPKHVEE
ncbi:MAG TPA: PAS domain S-box protein [Bryobacteraceae bacterium]|nr:PAS domain S-box protein [Bryobacteraceae bacterium]